MHICNGRTFHGDIIGEMRHLTMIYSANTARHEHADAPCACALCLAPAFLFMRQPHRRICVCVCVCMVVFVHDIQHKISSDR